MQDLDVLRFAPPSDETNEPRFEVSAGAKHWSARAKIWQPPTDMYETEDSIVVQIEIAGMRSAEFLISLEKRTLAIGGVRQTKVPGGACHQLEIPSGEFVSILELPASIDYDRVEAEYSDGFLQVVLPKALPSTIKINE
ncbi:MAG: Hsp20/alpha crystallin family protein [Chloroflexota bacterium]